MWMALAVFAIAFTLVSTTALSFSMVDGDSLGGILSAIVILLCIANLLILHKLQRFF